MNIDIEAIVNRVSLGAFPINIRLVSDNRKQQVGIIVFCKDAESASGRDFVVSREFSVPPIADEKQLVRWIYSCVLQVLDHELGEYFRFDNALVKPPHRGQA